MTTLELEFTWNWPVATDGRVARPRDGARRGTRPVPDEGLHERARVQAEAEAPRRGDVSAFPRNEELAVARPVPVTRIFMPGRNVSPG